MLRQSVGAVWACMAAMATFLGVRPRYTHTMHIQVENFGFLGIQINTYDDREQSGKNVSLLFRRFFSEYMRFR